MAWLFIKLGIRFLIFGLVVCLISHRSEKVSIKPKFALPLVALVFALLNTGIYWVAKPLLNLATLGMLWIFIPFVLNACFLYATARLIKYLRVEMEIKGILTMAWLALLLTAAHGVLYVALDVLAT